MVTFGAVTDTSDETEDICKFNLTLEMIPGDGLKGLKAEIKTNKSPQDPRYLQKYIQIALYYNVLGMCSCDNSQEANEGVLSMSTTTRPVFAAGRPNTRLEWTQMSYARVLEVDEPCSNTCGGSYNKEGELKYFDLYGSDMKYAQTGGETNTEVWEAGRCRSSINLKTFSTDRDLTDWINCLLDRDDSQPRIISMTSIGIKAALNAKLKELSDGLLNQKCAEMVARTNRIFTT